VVGSQHAWLLQREIYPNILVTLPTIWTQGLAFRLSHLSHLSFGSTTASRRLNLTNQGAHYQYKGPGEEMPAEGGPKDVKAAA